LSLLARCNCIAYQPQSVFYTQSNLVIVSNINRNRYSTHTEQCFRKLITTTQLYKLRASSLLIKLYEYVGLAVFTNVDGDISSRIY